MIKITKSKLITLYLKKKMSTPDIAKLYKCDDYTIYSKLKKYNIKIRSISEALKIIFKDPKKHPNYKDGRTFKKYYCRDCGKQIERHTGIKKGRCMSCAKLYLWKDKSYRKKFKKALHTHHIDGNHLNHCNNEIKLTSKKHRKAHNSLLQVAYDLVKSGDIIFNIKEKVYEYNG